MRIRENETWSGWWTSPTQCPRNFKARAFSASPAVVDDRTPTSAVIALTTHAPAQLSPGARPAAPDGHQQGVAVELGPEK